MEIFFLLGFFLQENILSTSQYSEFFLSECASKVNERRLFDFKTCDFQGSNCDILSLVFFFSQEYHDVWSTAFKGYSFGGTHGGENVFTFFRACRVSHMYKAHYLRRLRTECLTEFY